MSENFSFSLYILNNEFLKIALFELKKESSYGKNTTNTKTESFPMTLFYLNQTW